MSAHGLTDEPALSQAPLTETLQRLVRTPSTNPGEYEEQMAAVIEDLLRRRTSATVTSVETLPGRRSLAAVIGDSTGTRLILNGHLDTVPIGDPSTWTCDPLGGEVRDGRLYGRGACDMKAGLAIMVALAEWASSTALDGSLVLQFAVGEETAEPGTSSLLAAGFGGDVGVTLEPTSLDVGIATRGLAHIEVTLHGRSGHAGRIDFDGNPLDRLPDVLAALGEYAEDARTVVHPVLGTGSSTLTGIRAGEKDNVVPDRCTLVLDRRLLPGESVEAELERIRDRLRRIPGLSGEARSFEVGLRTPGFPAAEASPGSEFAELVRRCARAAGAGSELVGTPYASDVSRLLIDGGLEAVTFGPGSIDDCHRPDESVSLSEVTTAAEALVRVVSEVVLQR